MEGKGRDEKGREGRNENDKKKDKERQGSKARKQGRKGAWFWDRKPREEKKSQDG